MEYIRRILQTTRIVASDEKLAQQNAVVNPAFSQQEKNSGPVSRNEALPSFERGDKLQEFRLLVGIISDSSFRAPRGFNVAHRPVVTVAGRPAPNVGIYVMVVDKVVKSRQSYKHFSITINACLGAQIVVAAALTALGAAGHGRAGVVVLGAINTVIAGFLTYLKGSGLPNRLKYFQHEWDRVRDYIEARERDLMCSDDAFDIYEQIEIIRRMYEDVKADVERNTPDRFVGTARQNDSSMMRSNGPTTNSTSSPAGEMYGDVNGKLSRMESNAGAQRISNFDKDTMQGPNHTRGRTPDFSVRFSNGVHGLQQGVQDKIRELGELEKQIGSHGDALVRQKESEARAKAQEAESLRRDLAASGNRIVDDGEAEIARLQREIEERTRSIANMRAAQLVKEVEKSRESLEQDIHS